MGPQQAVEEAVLYYLTLASGSGGLALSSNDTGRNFDGRPPPRWGGLVYASVWSDGARASNSRTAMDETFTVNVTVTARLNLPADRWHDTRDDVSERLDSIEAFVHKDQYAFLISRKASTLAAFDGVAEPVGFREALQLLRRGPWEEKGADWFRSKRPEGGAGLPCGIAQTAYFGGVRRVRNLQYLA